jgi:hypothetical protein
MRVSLPLAAHRGRLYAALAALCAMATVAVALAATPPQAQAAFALNKCEGTEITGEGSSLQKLAQANWISQIFDTTLYGGCGASAPKVTFTTASSGCGLDAMGAGTAASSCTFTTKEQKEWEKPGYRDGTVRYGAADFAPTPEEEKNIDDGPTGAGTAGSGEVHVIPVAGAAITVVVHFPNGCGLQNPAQDGGNADTSTGGYPVPEATKGEVKAGEEDRNNDPSGGYTGDKFSNQTLRVHISDQKLEEIWQGQVTTWGEVVPKADFVEAAENGFKMTQEECAKTPIVRIVRQDTSGTTYNFKHFLALLPSFKSEGGAKLWTASSSQVGNTNTAWPIGSATEVGVPPAVEPPEIGKAKNPNGNECNATVGPKHICHAYEGSGGSLSNAVIATNGSIGYLDLATAREKGYNMTPNSTGKLPGESGFEETKNDRLYWIPLEPVEPATSESGIGTTDTGVFVEPTVLPTAHGSSGNEIKGANCAGADYRGYPSAAESPNGDPTLGDWSKAIATGATHEAFTKAATTAYPVCALTYDLAFDDDATVYGNTPTEEARARTVFDYLTSVVSPAGQFDLPEFDYAALPSTIVEDAEKGVASIGWNKAAGSTSGNNGSNSKTGSTNTGGGTVTTGVITPVLPSNAFSIASAKVKGKDIVLALVLPDAGSVQVKATGGGVTVGSVSASTSGGKGTVTLAISKAALSKLAKAKGHKLSVKITVTFTPTGGTAASQTKTLTVTQAAVTPPKKKASKKGKKK